MRSDVRARCRRNIDPRPREDAPLPREATPQAVRDSITTWSSQSFVPIDPNRYFTNGTQRKPFYGAVQPRVGVSYSLNQAATTTAFAGFGVYYDRITYNSTIDEQYRRHDEH